MAILTRFGFEQLARRIMETGGMTEQMEKDVKRLKDDFDEREGLLRKYGEIYDGEEKEEYEWKEREQEIKYDTKDTTVLAETSMNAIDYEKEYKLLRQRYLDRFLGREPLPNNDFDNIMQNQTEDTIADSGTKSINDLLYGSKDNEKGEK